MQEITPFLWFDDQAEAAAKFYTSIFKQSKITHVARYPQSAEGVAGRPAGSVMTVAFEIAGQRFTALNGGPIFKFNASISFVVNCDSQKEVDYYWEKLSAGGDKNAKRCGWLKDRYGISWQIVPAILGELMTSEDPAQAERVMGALLEMKKLDLAALKAAAKAPAKSRRKTRR